MEVGNWNFEFEVTLRTKLHLAFCAQLSSDTMPSCSPPYWVRQMPCTQSVFTIEVVVACYCCTSVQGNAVSSTHDGLAGSSGDEGVADDNEMKKGRRMAGTVRNAPTFFLFCSHLARLGLGPFRLAFRDPCLAGASQCCCPTTWQPGCCGQSLTDYTCTKAAQQLNHWVDRIADLRGPIGWRPEKSFVAKCRRVRGSPSGSRILFCPVAALLAREYPVSKRWRVCRATAKKHVCPRACTRRCEHAINSQNFACFFSYEISWLEICGLPAVRTYGCLPNS